MLLAHVLIIDFFLCFGIFHFLSHLLPLIRNLSQSASRQVSITSTLVAERHLAPCFKHWSWFYSLSYTKHFGSLFSGGACFRSPLTLPDTHRKLNQNPLCCGFKSCSVVHFCFCPHRHYSVFESACVVSIFFLHLACDPLCLEQRGIFKAQTHRLCWHEHIPLFHHQENSFILSLPPGVWFIQA